MSTSTKNSTRIEEEVIQIKNAQDNPAAFKVLYEKYYKPIFLFVLHRIGEKNLSADITSQVFLKALVNLPRYKFQGLPFSAWLYRIAINESYEFLRKSKRHRVIALDESVIEDLYDGLTTDTRIADLQERLPEILEQLSIDEMHILELRFFEKKPFREVADILAISESHAKVRTYRLLDKMRKIFMGKSML